MTETIPPFELLDGAPEYEYFRQLNCKIRFYRGRMQNNSMYKYQMLNIITGMADCLAMVMRDNRTLCEEAEKLFGMVEDRDVDVADLLREYERYDKLLNPSRDDDAERMEIGGVLLSDDDIRAATDEELPGEVSRRLRAKYNARRGEQPDDSVPLSPEPMSREPFSSAPQPSAPLSPEPKSCPTE